MREREKKREKEEGKEEDEEKEQNKIGLINFQEDLRGA